MKNEINEPERLEVNTVNVGMSTEEIIAGIVLVLVALAVLYWFFTSGKPALVSARGSVAASAIKSTLGAAEIAAMLSV